MDCHALVPARKVAKETNTRTNTTGNIRRETIGSFYSKNTTPTPDFTSAGAVCCADAPSETEPAESP